MGGIALTVFATAVFSRRMDTGKTFQRHALFITLMWFSLAVTGVGCAFMGY